MQALLQHTTFEWVGASVNLDGTITLKVAQGAIAEEAARKITTKSPRNDDGHICILALAPFLNLAILAVLLNLAIMYAPGSGCGVRLMIFK